MKPRRRTPALSRHDRLIDGDAAASALGVKRASLYAYVSRGLVRTAPHPTDPRAKLYSAADIEALQSRKLRLRRPRAAAASALDWGLPVLQTQISSIETEALFYRGQAVTQLVRQAGLEQVAAVLMGAEPQRFAALAFDTATIPAWQATAAVLPATMSAMERALALLPLLMAQQTSPVGLARDRLLDQAAQCMAALTAAIAGLSKVKSPLHLALAKAWQRPQAADVIRRMLVLSADHELNPSTFALRVTASTGTKLAGCLLSGLAALSGPRHGGVATRLQALVEELAAGDATTFRAAITARLSRGEALPGFGHPLYPGGDPRAALMLPLLKPDRPMARLLAVARDIGGLEPNIDFALLATEREHALPRGAALSMFAIGRCAGWLAHALEQIEMGTLIRPRAEFVGR